MMRIAISSTGPDLKGTVDMRFGRCRYFVLVDPETLEFEYVSNAAANVSAGAGVPAALLVANRGARAVLSGEIGPSAAETLSDYGISMFSGIRGSVLEAVQKFKEGKLRHGQGATVASGFGLIGTD
jgi:predicted Fe-Mo cluster-binding NifX family protein